MQSILALRKEQTIPAQKAEACREVFKAEFTGRFYITSVSECELAVHSQQEHELTRHLDDARAKRKLTHDPKAPALRVPPACASFLAVYPSSEP